MTWPLWPSVIGLLCVRPHLSLRARSRTTAFEPKSLAPLRPEHDTPFYDATQEGVVRIKDEAETTVFWL